MKKLPVLLFLLCLTSVTSLAQSGRKTAAPLPTPKVDTAPQPASSITVEGSDSPTSSTGETVEEDIVRVDTALVTVPVTVADRFGKYVPDLRREDFHLFEEGVEQKIAYFASVDQPFTVLLVIDTSGSTRFRLEDIQDAAINFVSRLKDEDSVMVMSFDDRIQVLTPPTSDRDAVTRAIRHTHTGGGTRLYDAVDDILKKQLIAMSGRKAVVLFTDGVDTTSRHASFSGTLHSAEEADAPFYSVDYDTSGTTIGMGQGLPIPGSRGGILIGVPFPGGRGGGGSPGSSPSDYRRASEYLHEISETTGGRFYSADSLVGISQAFEWIADELRRQYSLGYYPKKTAANPSGQRRQIKVKVNQSDLVVKARDSYIYSDRKPAKTSPDKQPYVADVPIRRPWR